MRRLQTILEGVCRRSSGSVDHSQVRFVLHIVEVDIAAWHAGSYDAERDLDVRNKITSLDELQEILAPSLDDFSALVSRYEIP